MTAKWQWGGSLGGPEDLGAFQTTLDKKCADVEWEDFVLP